ncbi:murein L,D-transpeptidase YcbB/YkuD [Flavobacterium sp. 90]|uniref:L,D-transpeptidase family protein n=1 Tax=unclassified Flavobacterium TaxID=196869 RepID=UPI000EB2376E|nr:MULTISPECIES: L,D-transpeptidase family protein [unclassified Flavobacterium]RKR08592.1 murein L,D-transpeptidase YcbB/YkuD [Flavobacterium sp. 81]TCK52382.1 murein L,D-transpeptidase YcbB/YkuD [Flavobacterium sp. 90]
MKTLYPFAIILVVSFFTSSFNNLDKDEVITKKTSADIYKNTTDKNDDVVDTEILNDFFRRYSDLKKYQDDVISLYKNRSYGTIWYKNGKVTEFGNQFYKKLSSSEKEGSKLDFPYKAEVNQIFNETSTEKLSKTDADMLLSAAFIVYANHAIEGKKAISYETLLDSLMTQPTSLEKNNAGVSNQYDKLQSALKKYKNIEKENNWKPITTETPYKDIRPDAKSITVAQIRNRLFVMGDLKNDSKSDVYDQELMDGVMKYKLRNGLKPNYIINEDNIKDLNTPIADKIKTLMINIERAKTTLPQLSKDKEYIMVNVPSFELVYVKNGKIELTSKVFVGSQLTKTTIFNGTIEKVVFSPYWTVPQSIVDNELKSKIAADKNYLAEHNMEIVNGQVRQKPGPDNSLGLVKFIFPNPDDIYMHDTPAKTLFDFEKRTFSHGCVNVNKAKELAIAMLKDYPEWTEDRITKAMDGTEETTFKLPNKVPIYITYFTSWVNESGQVSFFQDVYDRDSDLNNVITTPAEVASN